MTSPTSTSCDIGNAMSELFRRSQRNNFTPTQTLRELFPDIPNFSNNLSQIPVELTTDSRRVIPGSVFFAVDGNRQDGHDFIPDAISRGAIAVVSQHSLAEQIPASSGVAAIEVTDVHRAIAIAAARFYSQPAKKLSMIGITGTKGKTTSTFLTRYLLQSSSAVVGMLSTIENDLGERVMPSSRTTAEAIDIAGYLRRMCDSGCTHTVMEVSSHGLQQRRTFGIGFEVAIFTNLAPEHQDYHKTIEDYFNAKKKLFNGENGPLPKKSIINLDDPWGQRLYAELCETYKNSEDILTYGHLDACDLQIVEEMGDSQNTLFTLKLGNRRYRATMPIIGPHNVMNSVAALSTIYALGKNLKNAIEALSKFPGVPGRLEKIKSPQPFDVIVDYAHTAESLDCTLKSLRQIYPQPRRIITVFGCGGNRDTFKRPRMTTAAMQSSDITIATADNPRRENLEDIFAMMKTGILPQRSIEFIANRRDAIGRAISLAEPGDCVLIAGKGHETYQEFADVVVPFDDRTVAREFLSCCSNDRTPEDCSIGALQ